MADQKSREEVNKPGPAVEPSGVGSRRRFVGRWAKGGTGFVALTVYHRRGFGQTLFPFHASSAAECTSLGGVPEQPVPTDRSVGVTCNAPPQATTGSSTLWSSDPDAKSPNGNNGNHFGQLK